MAWKPAVDRDEKKKFDEENNETSRCRSLYDNMDSVGRRDKLGMIRSKQLSRQGRENYDKINWG